MSIPLTRRGLVGSALAGPLAVACTARGAHPPSLEGRTIASESVQLSCYSSDGQSGFTVRLGRFPEADVSWLWAHVFLPSQLIAFTDDRLPDADHREEAGQSSWRIGEGPLLSIVRSGAAMVPTKVALSGSWRGHANPRAPHGAGNVPITLEAVFTPSRSAEHVLPGRSEAKGAVAARVTLGRQTTLLAGDGHYHEQRQSVPRFTAPFVYLRGSNPDEAFTFIKAKNSSGSWVTDKGEMPVRHFDITAPAPQRRFRVGLDDGRTLQGALTQTHQFWLPIFDAARFSQIATGTLDGRRWVGGVNDWLGGKLEYWQA